MITVKRHIHTPRTVHVLFHSSRRQTLVENRKFSYNSPNYIHCPRWRWPVRISPRL